MVWLEKDNLELRDIEHLASLGINVFDRTSYGWAQAARMANIDADAVFDSANACTDIRVYMWLKSRQYALERACWVMAKREVEHYGQAKTS